MEVFGLEHRSNYLPMLQRLAGEHPIDSLKILAEIVEPVKVYSRPRTRAYTQLTPLDRLVDAARPESHAGRKFINLVKCYLDEKQKDQNDIKKIREHLTRWWDNHAILLPVLKASPRLTEIIPLSADVAALASAGLQALDFLENGEKASIDWLNGMLPLLSRPPLPEYELIIKILPAIQALVYAARPPLVIEDFEDGEAQGWVPNIPENWHIGAESGSLCYQLREPGIQGEVRAPTSWTVLKDHDLADLIFSGRLKCNAEMDNPHRDMVVIFHYQDPTHFYYVHFSASSDGNHNVIGLVDGKDRVKINLEPPGESIARLTDMQFHAFKVTYSSQTGEIKAYLDDMKIPLLTAKDRTISHGLVGVGSFDDTGSFDDIILWGGKE
jgi:hypothetical protein